MKAIDTNYEKGCGSAFCYKTDKVVYTSEYQIVHYHHNEVMLVIKEPGFVKYVVYNIET